MSTTRHFEFSDINAAKYNPRVTLKPNDKEYQDIRASLTEFGYLGGGVVNTRTTPPTLVGGHQRVQIMTDMGKTGADFATVDLDPISEKRLNVILNKVAGRWSNPDLSTLLQELSANQINLEALGFNRVELAALLQTSPKRTRRDPDDAPSAPTEENAVTKPGDIYEITTTTGAHRLLCGSSTDPKDMATLCGKTKARVIITDPPYGVAFRGDYRGQQACAPIKNDALEGAALVDFLSDAFKLAHAHSIPKAAMYVFYANANANANAIEKAGWRVKQNLIWMKQHFTLARHDYHWMHEPIFYAAKDGNNCEWFGPRTETTLFESERPDIDKMSKADMTAMLKSICANGDVWHESRDPATTYIHPTQKPVSLASRALRNSSMPSDHCLELFAGSGSTIVACELIGRHALAMELSRGHCDAIIRRFAETFEDVTITRNGKKFNPAKVGADTAK